ncbi:MAG: putative lipid II flippase FtsW [Candidatus Hydrogenedentes bacterium]|nr:putative lipid II flippase FtsW [Candidatus Hydrogenedentota bacterium]
MKRDTVLLINVVLTLTLVGILTVYSASTVGTMAANRLKNPDVFYYLRHQCLYALVGLVCMFFAARFDYHYFQKPGVYRLLALTSLSLLGLVFVPGIGVEVGGASRWIQLAGFRFQPSELAKLAVIVLLAAKLTENQEQITTFWRGFIPPMAVVAVFLTAILIEPDLGVPVVLCLVAMVMVYVAGARAVYLVGIGLAAVGGVLAMIVTTPYRWQRLIAYLNPWDYHDDKGFQLIQSLAAFAYGAVWGRGPGAGEQKLSYLPFAHTDFIFAVWAEEMGLIGTIALVAAFIVLLVVATRIAVCAPDLFGSLLAVGILALLSIQTVINMAVTTGLLPTKGLPLPFISAGGSALIVNFTLVGILLSIGLRAREPERRGQPVLAT